MTDAPKSSLNEDYSPVFQDIARFRQLIFDSLLKPHNVTMSQGFVLVQLFRENGLRQADIAQRMQVAPVTTSKLIDKLEAQGYVERRSDPEDRRSNRIWATDRGLAIVKTMTRTVRDIDQIANEGLSDAEFVTVIKALTVMRKNLQKAAAQR